jgi:hypothetical protein
LLINGPDRDIRIIFSDHFHGHNRSLWLTVVCDL